MEHQRTQNACYIIEKNFQIFVSEYSGTITNSFEDALNAYQQLVISRGFKFDWRQLDNATGLNICSTSSFSYKYIMKALKNQKEKSELETKNIHCKVINNELYIIEIKVYAPVCYVLEHNYEGDKDGDNSNEFSMQYAECKADILQEISVISYNSPLNDSVMKYPFDEMYSQYFE
ncbi:Hypothetical_protein [Hexamita inflata]|uniref:Hypothetical_protein n=1 Tax=Hexamita inflata TaxID=28002 RepID=A0AA86V098_9EUKA|nr:Hypothetical protein HINF_LOCUS58847 [Hexamita inflata]